MCLFIISLSGNLRTDLFNVIWCVAGSGPAVIIRIGGETTLGLLDMTLGGCSESLDVANLSSSSTSFSNDDLASGEPKKKFV